MRSFARDDSLIFVENNIHTLRQRILLQLYRSTMLYLIIYRILVVRLSPFGGCLFRLFDERKPAIFIGSLQSIGVFVVLRPALVKIPKYKALSEYLLLRVLRALTIYVALVIAWFLGDGHHHALLAAGYHERLVRLADYLVLLLSLLLQGRCPFKWVIYRSLCVHAWGCCHIRLDRYSKAMFGWGAFQGRCLF